MKWDFLRSKGDQGLPEGSFSKVQRYTAFLITYLPRFANVPLYPKRMIKGEPWRGDVLIRTLDMARRRKGLFLEFGVYRGKSITVSANRLKKRRFVGFDSFEGFPDDGRTDWDQSFALPSLPEVPENVELVKGFFSASLPEFCRTTDFDLAFLNVDCDIYSSARDVLFILHDFGKIAPGLPVYFDELLNYRGAYANELLALFEFLEFTGFGIDCACVHDKVRTLDESIELAEAGAHPAWNADVGAGYRQQAGVVINRSGIDFSVLKDPVGRDRVFDIAERMVRAGLVDANI